MGGWAGRDALQQLPCWCASPIEWLPIRQKDNYIQHTELHLSWVRLSLNTWSWTTFHGVQWGFLFLTPVQPTVNMGQRRLYAECRLTFLPWLHSGQDILCTLWTPASCKEHSFHVNIYHCRPQFWVSFHRLRLESLVVYRDQWIQLYGYRTVLHKICMT